MEKITFLIFLLTSFSLINTETISMCKCPSKHDAPQTIKVNDKYSPSNVIIDGVNYGKPFVIGDLIFLTKNVAIERGITELSNSCPTGYRLPTKTEYQKLLSSLGTKANSVLTDKSGFNFQSGSLYMTNDKVYSTTDGSDNDAWCFYGLAYSDSKYEVKIINTFWDIDSMKAKCILDTKNVKLNVDGLDYDLLTDEKRTLTIDRTILKGLLWRLGNKISSVNKTEILNTERGCDILEIWGVALNNKALYECKIVYTRPKIGNSETGTFTISKVSTLKNTFSSERVGSIYFERPQAPITPKSDGGYYLAYNNKKNNKLTVVEFDKTDKIITEKELGYKAFPLDIIETDFGFAIYARDAEDDDHSFIVIYTFDYTKVAETTIMNNGEQPKQSKNALIFYDSNGAPLFGIDNMFNPHNGKLAYGRGKLNLIFAHYNNFNGEEGHTGDTYYSFDLSGSTKTAKYAWSWQSSHSLIQSHIYNGKYFICVSLGDAYPEGINLSIIDISKGGNSYDSTRKNYPNIGYITESEMFGVITGNHGGSSYGRLGGVLQFDSVYVVVYSIKKSSGDDRDGIFLTKFSYEKEKIKFIKTEYILHGKAGKLINIRCAKYGGRILITYILTKTDYGLDYVPSHQDLNEEMYYLVTDLNGKNILGPYKSTEQNEAISEDIRELKDGSLRWGYVDKNDVLKIVKVEAPTKS